VIVAFIDEMRALGHAVESICRVLCEQGCQVAARTYRAWSQPAQEVAARTLSDALVEDCVRDLAWTVESDGRRRLTPEGLYGRRKMLRAVRHSIPDATPGSVDRAMRSLGLVGVRRAKGVRTTIPAKDGRRAGDLLNRDFTAPAPNMKWVMDFTYVRTWTGFTYVAFIVDVFARRIVAWNAATAKDTDLVMAPLRMAIWQRDRDGHPIVPGELIGHADAGSQGELNWSSQHLDDGGVIDGDDEGAAAAGSAVSGADPVAGSSDGRVARGSCPVLGSDRARREDRRRRCRGGRVIPRRVSVVSARWRREPMLASDRVGPLPVVLRA